ncbi:unnamed protein product [Staurois parvus]|uniref:Uncharacterized protein n=1 Tax=Staurois parvus TaxID=386267 RepID=A0ABN9E7N5_9NEOB|nr:unnamed protein product [Staurois parvus]
MPWYRDLRLLIPVIDGIAPSLLYRRMTNCHWNRSAMQFFIEKHLLPTNPHRLLY